MGPRFNSNYEIGFLNAGCHTISQTTGPEIILAGEAEIAFILLGFGVDYANGVNDEPAQVEIINENLGQAGLYFLL